MLFLSSQKLSVLHAIGKHHLFFSHVALSHVALQWVLLPPESPHNASPTRWCEGREKQS